MLSAVLRRIAVYRPDPGSMLRTPEMRERNRKIAELCKSFEPVMYDVVESFA